MDLGSACTEDDSFFLSTPRLRVPPGSSTELSTTGWAFLAQLFEQHDKDKDGALCDSEWASLFAPCPVSPWGPTLRYTVPTDAQVLFFFSFPFSPFSRFTSFIECYRVLSTFTGSYLVLLGFT